MRRDYGAIRQSIKPGGKHNETTRPAEVEARYNNKAMKVVEFSVLVVAMVAVLIIGAEISEKKANSSVLVLGMPSSPAAAVVSTSSIVNGFTQNLEGLKWYCAPDSWKKNNTVAAAADDDSEEGEGGWWNVTDDGKLLFAPPAKKDFWRKTYYEPLLVKDDGSFLYATVKQKDLPVTIETTFSLTPKAQFDQAGIIIRADHEHWIKTGIEVVDQQPRLSCVVTNGFSDWSTQNWNQPEIKIRVHLLAQHGGSFVVEAAPVGGTEDDWSFIRIAHMNRDFNHDLLNDDPAVQSAYQGESAPPDSLMVGVFAACPVDQAGMVATFQNLTITKGSTFVHTA